MSFCTTVLPAGIVPTLPPWLISTVPSGLTVISSSLKFLSGLASLTACLTFVFSSSVNAFLFSTGTGFSGGLNSLVTSFCLTVFSGANVPVLPSLVFTVTVPSSATVMSAFVRVKVGFAFITASLTLSFSSDVNDFKSFTSTFSGSFNVNFSAVFSQTAYTVFDSVMLDGSVTFASLASFESAQPLNVYPSLVGSSTLANSLVSLVISSLPSVNLPPLASKVTTLSFV